MTPFLVPGFVIPLRLADGGQKPNPPDDLPARAPGPDGQLLPFITDAEVLEFLQAAKVVSSEDIPVGWTKPVRAILHRNDEQDRIDQNIAPPNPTWWRGVFGTLIVFDNLIFNADRNTGNLLIDPDWEGASR